MNMIPVNSSTVISIMLREVFMNSNNFNLARNSDQYQFHNTLYTAKVISTDVPSSDINKITIIIIYAIIYFCILLTQDCLHHQWYNSQGHLSSV